jgi:primosomal protein N''
MNLFGKKKEAPRAPDPAQAVFKLREQMEVLEKKVAYLEVKVANSIRLAKSKLQTDRKGFSSSNSIFSTYFRKVSYII